MPRPPIPPKVFINSEGEHDVDSFTCQQCRFWGVRRSGNRCPCIDHRFVNFARPWFSSDVMTGSHVICRLFQPDREACPAAACLWDTLGGFDRWFHLWNKQWHPRIDYDLAFMGLNLARPIPGRHHSDDRFYVPAMAFFNAEMIRDGKIACSYATHIRKSKSSPLGYEWIREGSPVLDFSAMTPLEDEV